MSEIRIDRTGQPEVIAASDGSLTVTVPIRIKRRGLRKVVTLPDGSSEQLRPWDYTPTPLQLALAHGHRWLAMLESDEVGSMKEIARREVDDYERAYLSSCLKRFRGNIAQCAQHCGVDSKDFYRKMQEYGFDKPDFKHEPA